jgi:hypothetical protein
LCGFKKEITGTNGIYALVSIDQQLQSPVNDRAQLKYYSFKLTFPLAFSIPTTIPLFPFPLPWPLPLFPPLYFG